MKKCMTDKQKKLAEENHNLIYACLKKYNLPVDEFYDIAAIGLCKAAILFNEEKGYSFSTLACHIINNELKMCFRKNVQKSAIPFDCLLYYQDTVSDVDGHIKEILDFMPDNVNVESEVITNIVIEELAGKLSERDRLVFDMLMLGYRQIDICSVVGLSQPQISRIKRKIIKILEED